MRLEEGDLAGFPYEIDHIPWDSLRSKIDIVPTDSDGNYLTPTSVRRLALLFIDSKTEARPQILNESMFSDRPSYPEAVGRRLKLWYETDVVEYENEAFATERVPAERRVPNQSRSFQPIPGTPSMSKEALASTPGFASDAQAPGSTLVASRASTPSVDNKIVDDQSVNTSRDSQGEKVSCWSYIIRKLLLCWWNVDF
jgi:hypothetical protein